MIHGVFPFLCERTASRTITALHARLGRRVAASVESPAARPPEFAATAGS